MTQALKRGGGGGIGGIGPAILPLEVALPIGQGSYATGMGKGLSEPCSPYREANVFGAPLNTPNADNWNCVPQIIEPTLSFDLSTIEPNHEVVVALLVAYNLPAGSSYWVHQKWYRDRDGQLLFEFAYTIPDPADYGYTSWASYYVYSYIGYVSWEIWENGAYHVDLTLSGGAQSFSQTLNFTVTGIVAGTISNKELEYNESRQAIPAYDVPQGQRGLVHVWGRNDTPVTQRMGIYWFVADPNGYVVEEYTTWEAWPYTGPGAEHEFIGGRFDLDKVGKYTMWLELLMNPDNPQVVDTYIGDLCTVEVAPVPLTGEIFAKRIWWEGLGAYWVEFVSGREIPLGKEIHLLIYWRSNFSITGHLDLTVTYPDGTSHPVAVATFQDYVGCGHGVTFEPFLSSQDGTYTIVITLSHEGQVLDTVTFELVVAAVPEPQFRDFAVSEYTKV